MGEVKTQWLNNLTIEQLLEIQYESGTGSQQRRREFSDNMDSEYFETSPVKKKSSDKPLKEKTLEEKQDFIEVFDSPEDVELMPH